MRAGLKRFGFLLGCILIFFAPHLMYISVPLIPYPQGLPRSVKAVGIFSLMHYPLSILIGLFTLFCGIVLIWKNKGGLQK